MRAVSFIVMIALAACVPSFASADPTDPEAGSGRPAGEGMNLLDLSTLPPAARFDFLVGEWTYEFDKGHGSTRYRRAADGTAIQETLEQGFISGREFAGSSILLFDAEVDQWHHNWIDSLGNVLEGRGSMEPYEESALPAMITIAKLDGTLFKHVWYDISPDRFETDLYASTDGGGTYQLIRRMPFLRRR